MVYTNRFIGIYIIYTKIIYLVQVVMRVDFIFYFFIKCRFFVTLILLELLFDI